MWRENGHKCTLESAQWDAISFSRMFLGVTVTLTSGQLAIKCFPKAVLVKHVRYEAVSFLTDGCVQVTH